MTFKSRLASVAIAAVAVLSGASITTAQEVPLSPTVQATTPILRNWMSPDVGYAWSLGFKGQRSTMVFVDDFTSSSRFYGKLGSSTQYLRHGEWTLLEGALIAPEASLRAHDFRSGKAVALGTGLNVVNLSYGMYAKSGYSLSQLGWSAQESSIISHAGGKAVIAKAAGNDGIRVGGVNANGQTDYLNLALVGKPSAIIVGALSRNGTTTNPASLASYSNRAGADATVQKQFVVVGVEGNKTGIYGTSFAAPVVSGYAAILGSKFSTATPTQITNQLLTTARKDTLLNFDAAIYGRGEASLSRALAPISIK